MKFSKIEPTNCSLFTSPFNPTTNRSFLGKWKGGLLTLPKNLYSQTTYEYFEDQTCIAILSYYGGPKGADLLYTYRFVGAFSLEPDSEKDQWVCKTYTSQAWVCPKKDEITHHFSNINLHDIDQWVCNEEIQIQEYPTLGRWHSVKVFIQKNRLQITYFLGQHNRIKKEVFYRE